MQCAMYHYIHLACLGSWKGEVKREPSLLFFTCSSPKWNKAGFDTDPYFIVI